MFQGIIELMYFVPDRRVAADWYAQLLDLPITCMADPEHYFLRVGQQDIWFHLADDKSPSGTGGQVAYWRVENFDAAQVRAEGLGAVLYRGPLDRGDGEWMCQMKDPFGNIFGLVGAKLRSEIILIGPIGAGKSTLGKLLSERLGLPQCSMDAVRWDYYNEIGYSETTEEELRKSGGFESVYRYWKPFEAHAVERLLSEHRNCVIDFGGGHSVFEDDALFHRVQTALAPYRNVILLLPSPDLEESIRLLNERNEEEEGSNINAHFVTHHSNHDLATDFGKVC